MRLIAIATVPIVLIGLAKIGSAFLLPLPPPPRLPLPNPFRILPMPPKKAAVAAAPPLKPFQDDGPDPTYPWEIALDECGRGPLFGRVYAAAVVLPRDPGAFDTALMRDSKKIHSKAKMAQLAEYIRTHAVASSVHYREADVIDAVNILQADMLCMHDCVSDVLEQLSRHPVLTPAHRHVSILVDGNYFRPYSVFDPAAESMYMVPYTTIEQGDATYASIAAASILAKHARDTYITELCEQYPELKLRYALDRNMGYGTAAHLKGIVEHGITQWHRRTFGRCKEARDGDPL